MINKMRSDIFKWRVGKSVIGCRTVCVYIGVNSSTYSKEDLLEALKKAFNAMVEERKEKLLEDDLQEGHEGKYFECYDEDDVDVGVGRVVVRSEIIQDEDQAFEDAKEEVISELVNNEEDAPYYLFENNEFTIALGKFLKGC